MKRFLSSLLAHFKKSPGNGRPPAARSSRPVRLALEQLEDRLVPTGLVVNNFSDPIQQNTVGTLRYEWNQAVHDANKGISDTITFASGNHTIVLYQGVLAEDNLQGSGTIVIDGGGTTTIDGNHTTQLFQQMNSKAGLTLEGLTLQNGAGQYGGAVAGGGPLTLRQCIFSGNGSSSGNGGAVFEGAGTLTASNCTFVGNKTGTGGAIAIFDGYGGAIASFTGCTFSGNEATSNYGGAIYNASQMLSLTNCTFSGNSAKYLGGAIYNDAALTGAFLTIAGNSAADGGGVYNNSGGGNGTIPSLKDSIIAGNSATTAPDIDLQDPPSTPPTRNVISYTFIGNGSSGLANSGISNKDANHNLVGSSSAMPSWLGPLANNGGPTQTMALLPGSPAIGAGTSVSSVSTDQRGQPLDRPPDLGAYQTQDAPTTSAGTTQFHGENYVATINSSSNIVLTNQTTGASVTLGDSAVGQPALAVYNNQLYIAWTGTNAAHNLNVALVQTNGSGAPTGLGSKYVDGNTSIAAPSLAAYNNQLYIAWTGTNAQHNLNVALVQTNGAGVATSVVSKLVLPDSSNSGPALWVSNNELWLSWVNLNGQTNEGEVFTNSAGAPVQL